MKTVTIFTPTYNRAYMIQNLFESLKKQSCFDFEWLVIDDGSTDNTEDLFREWVAAEMPFRIRFYKIENGGKCRAVNKALELAHGNLFLTIDSDDYLIEDAIEKVLQWEHDLPCGGLYCGVAGNLGTHISYTPNTLFCGEYYEGTLLDRYKNVDGERAIAFYTDIHRKYKYPEFDGEKFMTEAVAWNRMAADGYKVRFYNDIICVYEYQDDGLTKAGHSLFINNPKGYGLWLTEKVKFEKKSQREKYKIAYSFTCELWEHYDGKYIAECIGVNRCVIRIFRIINKIKRMIS